LLSFVLGLLPGEARLGRFEVGNLPVEASWAGRIPAEEWSVYRSVMDRMREAGVPFAVGGAFAVAAYTGQWRNTKDLDLYVLPKDREAAIGVLDRAGLKDYYSVLKYDRRWIYRSHTGPLIVDIIWAMANQRAQVDDAWLTRGAVLNLNGEVVKIIPPEELMWGKIYILQRERCDWPDVWNLIYSAGAGMDWRHLLDRTEGDRPLLAGVLGLYRWLFPEPSRRLPEWLWKELGLEAPRTEGKEEAGRRMRLLDAGLWFRHEIP
jgi:hypothetical protein